MKDPKSIILIFIIMVLIGAAGYLIYLIQDGSNPLILFDSNASQGVNPDADFDQLASAGQEASPTPTITFNSTSPTPSPTGAISLSPQLTQTQASPTPTIVELPDTGGGALVVTATPTPVMQLPQAGVNEWIGLMLMGAGSLIVLALLL